MRQIVLVTKPPATGRTAPLHVRMKNPKTRSKAHAPATIKPVTGTARLRTVAKKTKTPKRLRAYAMTNRLGFVHIRLAKTATNPSLLKPATA